jgi:hypothetical protein
MLMKAKPFKQIFIQLIPLLVWFLLIISRNELLITAGLIIAILATFKIKYYKGEWLFFLIGVIAGIILEVGGDLIYQLQYWQQGSLFGVPLWLPLFWGCAFVFIRRTGNLIVKDHT